MRLLIWGLVLLAVFPAYGAEVKVVDGDSLVIEGRRIRLQGIDAPEYSQTCGDKEGYDYPCGREALKFMKQLVQSGKVECQKIQKDIYKRDLSICYVNGEDINYKMIEYGWAVVYRTDNVDYLEAEKSARLTKRGVWQGKFMKPELYRVLMK